MKAIGKKYFLLYVLCAFSCNALSASALSANAATFYVTNSGNNTVTYGNTATNSIEGRVRGSFDTPWSIAIAPNGQKAYVVNGGNNRISVINNVTNTVEKTITNANLNFAGFVRKDRPIYPLAFSPNGRKAYVISRRSETNGRHIIPDNILYVIDTITDTITGVVADPGRTCDFFTSIAIAPDGNKAYATSANAIAIIDVRSNTIVGTVANTTAGSDRLYTHVAFTPDGNKAYVGSFVLGNSVFDYPRDGSISIIDVAADTVVATVTDDDPWYNRNFTYHFTQPSFIAMSPDGRHAYVVDRQYPDENIIKVIDVTRDAIIKSMDDDARTLGETISLAITPDSQHIYGVNIGSSTVSIIDASDGDYNVARTVADPAPYLLDSPAFMAFIPPISIPGQNSRISKSLKQLAPKSVVAKQKPHRGDTYASRFEQLLEKYEGEALKAIASAA